MKDKEYDWVRLFRADGRLVPTGDERAAMAEQRAEAESRRAETAEQRAEAAEQRAEAERERARAAEAEMARLRALLEEQGRSPRE